MCLSNENIFGIMVSTHRISRKSILLFNRTSKNDEFNNIVMKCVLYSFRFVEKK